MSLEIYRAYISPISYPDSKENKQLTIITEDGTVHQVQYEETSKKHTQETSFEPQEILIRTGKKYVYQTSTTVRIFKKFLLNKFLSELAPSVRLTELFTNKTVEVEQTDLQSLIEESIKEAKGVQSQQKKQKELTEKTALFRARTFHVITGTLVTPTEIASGLIELTVSTTKVAIGCFALLGAIGAKKISSHFPGNIHEEKINRGKTDILSFVFSALRDIRIALLKMVPIIGAQLANQYIETGGLKGFIDAPAFGGLLEKIGITIPRIVYGFRVLPFLRTRYLRGSKHYKRYRTSFQVLEDEKYLKLKKPTLAATITHIEKFSYSKSFIPSQGIMVRIPNQAGTRFHDGTLLLAAPNPKKETKTLVLYHGNAGHRDFNGTIARMYQKNGYNVLLASYAGDPVTQGDGTSHTEVLTKCTERSMREDAAADLFFLKSLGVKNVAVYGYSLGGAQAMNFAQAVGEDLEITMDSVYLNRTFTCMVDVVQNAVHNLTGSSLLSRLARDFTKKFIADETFDPARYGCDGLNSAQKLKEVTKKANFASTKFCFLGTTLDELMANLSEKSKKNFANDLALTLAFLGKNRVHKEIQHGSHTSLISHTNPLSFLGFEV